MHFKNAVLTNSDKINQVSKTNSVIIRIEWIAVLNKDSRSFKGKAEYPHIDHALLGNIVLL